MVRRCAVSRAGQNQPQENLAEVLAELRTWPDLREVRPSVFYLRGRPFLHFHHSRNGARADVRDGKEWGAPIPLPNGPLAGTMARQFLKEVAAGLRLCCELVQVMVVPILRSPRPQH
jgi:hypothetical protein